jgi:hypothetical protein
VTGLKSVKQLEELRPFPRVKRKKKVPGRGARRGGDRKSQLPMHSSRKELGKGLVNKILKDLGLK